ncbi:MAG: ABC transporter substrate-binding protein [Dehalococcoidia bacterium]
MATLVIACGGSDEEESTSTPEAGASESPTAAATLVAAGDADLADVQEITVRQYFEPGTLDPAFLFRIETENIAFNIYSGLTTFDPVTGAPMPDLAKSWDISDDGLEYTFHLVDNAQWQHGYGAFTSADVVYSYNRVMDEATGSPYRAEFNNVDSVTATDDYTVVIKLKQPDGNFLYQVGNYHQGQIVNQKAVEDFGDDYGRNPVGTGPFYIDSWTPDSEMVLLAHEGYFRGRPTLDKITWVLIRDVSAAETAFLNGEVDVMSNLGQGNTELIDRVAATEGVQIAKSEDYATSVTMFGADFEPFQSRDVRLAYALAIDYTSIVEQLTPRTARPWSSILPPWMPVYNPDLTPYGYDPEQAKELLAGAGYPDGFTVHSLVTGVNDAALLEQAMLAEVGIDLQFDVVEPAVFNQRRNAGDFELAGRLYPAVNPDTLLFGFLHPDNAAPAGLNGSKYDNPDVTRLLEEARASLDPEERLAKYYEAQQLVYDDVAYMATRASTNLWAAWGPIKNIQVNRLANVDFYPVYVGAGS